MKKQLIIVLALVLLLLPTSSCSSVSDLMPQALAADTQNTVQDVEQNSQNVFAEIQSNIDLVANLKTKMEQTKIDGKHLTIDDIIKDVQKVSQSYDKLSGQHEAIRKGLLQKIADIEDMQNKVDSEITILKQRRADYSDQLRKVSDPNLDIVRTRQASLTQAIKYVDTQILLWQNFNAIEANITTEMVNIQRTIDSFLSVIDSSAILFREGLNLLELQKNLNDALSLFTQDIPKMAQLTSDMEKSWANLNYLTETLTSVSTTGLMK